MLMSFKPIPKRQILDKLREVADNDVKFDENSKRGKTLWEKEKLLAKSNFPFPQCFQKTCTADT